MPIQSDGPAPYTAPKAIIDLIEAYRGRGLQTPFTTDVLVKAGVSETLAPRTLASLKLLDLIDEQGEPTPALVDLRKTAEAEFKTRFEALLRSAYAEVFSYVEPSQDSPERIRDAFRSYTPIGQQGRMVTLFLGLCEYAGIVPPSTERATSSGKSSTPRRGRRRGATRTTPPASVSRTVEDQGANLTDFVSTMFKPGPAAAGGHPLIQGLLRELPPVGATWPKAKMSSWLEAQRAVFALLYQAAEDDVPPRPPFPPSDEGGESG